MILERLEKLERLEQLEKLEKLEHLEQLEQLEQLEKTYSPMKKKLYFIPQTEVVIMKGTYNVMKTSIIPDIADPGASPAPKRRWTDVF